MVQPPQITLLASIPMLAYPKNTIPPQNSHLLTLSTKSNSQHRSQSQTLSKLSKTLYLSDTSMKHRCMMKQLMITALLLGLMGQLYAQRMPYLKKGNAFYEEGEFAQAIEQYEPLWESKAGRKIMGVDAKMNLANSYRLLDQPFKAEVLYKEVMDFANDRPLILMEYGKVLMSLGRYDEAIAQFELYQQKDEKATEPAELIERARNIGTIEPLFPSVEVNYEPAVNDSSTRQVGITYYGDAVVYASDELDNTTNDYRTKGYLNMHISGINVQGNLKAAEKFSQSLNSSERHDGPAAFSRDGQHIFYSQSVKARDGSTVLQIWMSSFREDRWTEPRPLEFMLQGSNFTHPALSADGRTLYFASDMKGSHGGLDIWMSTYDNGSWTYPVNLGTDINTAKDEGWPFIHPDGDLYFSSKGHPGYGGYDIFRTRPLGNGKDWLPIENLGQPFNTSFSDISFILSDDQTEGFFSSNRSRSYDIFKYILVGAEKQPLPPGIAARAGTGRSERPHPTVVVDDPLPPRPAGMSDPDYIEYVNDMIDKGQYTPPAGDDRFTQDDNNATASTTGGGQPSTPDGTNTTTTTTTTPVDGNPTQTTGVDPVYKNAGEKIELAVVLKVMDIANSRPLGDAEVVVRNKFTQIEEVFPVDQQGEVEISLDPDQKYTLIGRSAGYQESSIPVSTMGVAESDRVQANLPLAKVE